MCLERMWQNQLESHFLAKNCFETLRLIGRHLDDPPEAAAMTISIALRLTKSWSQLWVWRIRPKIMTSTAMMERSSRWAKRAAGRKTRTASRLSAGFPKLQFWFQRSGTWKKNAVQNSSMEWWKMQTFTGRKVEKQENIECIEMYRNVSDKKDGVIHV